MTPKVDLKILTDLKKSLLRDIRSPLFPMQTLRAASRIEVLETALLKYGCHTKECKLHTIWDEERNEASYRLSRSTGLECTCGLHELLGIEPAP